MVNKIKPQLDIIYSSIYDRQIHNWRGLQYEHRFDIMKYKQEITVKWKAVEQKVFDTITKISGLRWQKRIINCYLVQKSIAFSSPLTLPMLPDIDLRVMTIAHELVHNILEQNSENVDENKYFVKYANAHRIVKSHILHHSIFKFVLLEVFGSKDAKKYLEWDEIRPYYKKAWDIVELEGAKNIIKNCIKI